MGVPCDAQWIEGGDSKKNKQTNPPASAYNSPITKNDPKAKMSVTSKLENPSYWISDDGTWPKKLLGASKELTLWKQLLLL